MRIRAWCAVLCIGVSWPTGSVSSVTGFGTELLMGKLDYLQHKLHDSETAQERHTIKLLADIKKVVGQQTAYFTKLLESVSKAPATSCQDDSTGLSDKYLIQIGSSRKLVEVLCEQTAFGGGWTVIQHRFNGSVDFYRNWTEYREGFGSLDGEFWLGLERIHQMTSRRPHELIVEVKDFEGNYGYAMYSRFEIGSENEHYILKKLGVYSGTAGDSLKNDREEGFTTFDRDNDSKPDDNCAVL